MASWLTYAERRSLGLAARRQLARSGHAAFSAKGRATHPLGVLQAAARGRIPELVALKYRRMAASPFGFFRGAVPVMAADLAAHPNSGIVTQICGDAHVSNFGAYAGPDGRLVFDINDFDETLPGPFEWDVKRLATSLLLAGRLAGIRRAARREAVELFAEQYRQSMQQFAAMPVLELARFPIHRLHRLAPVARVLESAERSTPQRSLAKLTEVVAGKSRGAAAQRAEARLPPDGREPLALAASAALAWPSAEAQPGSKGARRFRSEPPLLTSLPEPEARKVLDALPAYAEALQPERRHFLAQYRPVDVAFKVVGTGSVGLRDYCIYFESSRSAVPGQDPLFLQIKEEPASAYAPYLPQAAEAWTEQGRRVVEGQRAMQLSSDPFLGYTAIEGRSYLVRQLNDHKASLDLQTLCAEDLRVYAGVCGELFARGHARAGDPVVIAAYLGSSPRFDHAVLGFARAYADQTEKDWSTLRKWLKTSARGDTGSA